MVASVMITKMVITVMVIILGVKIMRFNCTNCPQDSCVSPPICRVLCVLCVYRQNKFIQKVKGKGAPTYS